MKVLTVLGTRPEIIRLSRVIPLLDDLCDHVLVNTGQNFEPRLSEIFFEELEVREPNYSFDMKSEGFGEQAGKILALSEKVLQKEKPDRLLILGDTNSALCSIIAKRMSVPVYHMEAGNRCFDDRVPEEVNRRIIDQCSDVLMPYTERSRKNLLLEGFPVRRIYVTGNPIKEVLDHYSGRIDSSAIINDLGLEKKNYFLVTLHRKENVDEKDRLSGLIKGLELLHKEYGLPVVCSLHPRTKDRMEDFGIDRSGIRMMEPFGLFDFVNLEKNALCVLTDSGTVQEEACIFNVPSVTLRDVTERPETLEAGSNMLSGAEPATILSSVKTVLKKGADWTPPPEYLVSSVGEKIVKILLGHLE